MIGQQRATSLTDHKHAARRLSVCEVCQASPCPSITANASTYQPSPPWLKTPARALKPVQHCTPRLRPSSCTSTSKNIECLGTALQHDDRGGTHKHAHQEDGTAALGAPCPWAVLVEGHWVGWAVPPCCPQGCGTAVPPAHHTKCQLAHIEDDVVMKQAQSAEDDASSGSRHVTGCGTLRDGARQCLAADRLRDGCTACTAPIT